MHEAGRRAGRAAQRDGGLEAGLDAGRGVHDEQRGVGGVEALDHLGHEVGVAGRVDERDPVPSCSNVATARLSDSRALLLLGLEVEVRGAVVDLAEPGDRAGAKEELLGERRLAGAGVAGEDDAPEVGEVDALHRHRACPPVPSGRRPGERALRRSDWGSAGARRLRP